MNSRVNQMLVGTAVGFALLANLFLFLPLTLFVGNEKEFSVPFKSILISYAAPAFAALTIIALVSILLPANRFRLFAALMGVVGLLVWMQGNLFVWDYGLLDGAALEWKGKRIHGWVEMVAWLSAISLVIWRVRKLGESIVGIAITLGVLQLGLFSFNYFSSADVLKRGIDVDKENIAASKIYRYSKTGNIVHIIADGFQADILDEILTTDESGKQLSDALSGFTFFRKQLGAFPYTHMSVPAILSGKLYRNHMPIDEFMKSSLGEKSIISLAKKNNYEIDLGIPRGALTDLYDNVDPDYVFPVNGGGRLTHGDLVRKDATRLFDLALFRSVPHDLKKLVHNHQRWFIQSFYTGQDYHLSQNFLHMEFLKESAKQMTVDRDTNVYKLFHLMLSHQPMVTTADCLHSGGVIPTDRTNVISQARCGLQEIIVLLDAMKRSGIYESSTIIIMGDHGAWVPPSDFKSVLNEEKSTIESINPRIVAQATPFFAIKRPGDTGSLKFKDVPSAITDTAKTIATIQGFENDFDGTSVYNLLPELSRERIFMYYRYTRNEWTDNHLEPIEEFKISGDATNSASWTAVNTYSSDGEVQATTVKSSLWRTQSMDQQ